MQVRFRKEDLGYEKKANLLTGGGCASLLPLSIVRMGEEARGYYSAGDYTRLGRCGELDAAGIMTVAWGVICALEDCEQYLIFPEEFVLDLNTVFVSPRLDKVKFAYVPDRHQRSARMKLPALFRDMRTVTTENGGLYLDMLVQLLDGGDLSLKKVEAFILRLRREISLCGVS